MRFLILMIGMFLFGNCIHSNKEKPLEKTSNISQPFEKIIDPEDLNHYRGINVERGLGLNEEAYCFWRFAAEPWDTALLIIITNTTGKYMILNTAKLTVKKFKLYNKLRPIKIDSFISDSSFFVDITDWFRFKNLIVDSYFWNLKNDRNEYHGDIDCVEHIFEGARDSTGYDYKYNCFNASCLNGSLKVAGIFLMNLSISHSNKCQFKKQ